MPVESARELLGQLMDSCGHATEWSGSDTFLLQTKLSRWETPISLYVRIVPGAEGALVRAWAFPRWAMILWTFAWILFGLSVVHASAWFIVVGLAGVTFDFIVQTRRGYSLLRRIYAA
jgi:hypothetical protein